MSYQEPFTSPSPSQLNRLKVHSKLPMGTHDGPGMRYVLFLQGCPLRCLYCHNPDTWNKHEGHWEELDSIIKDITKYRSYYVPNGGGLTASGGEPLLQAKELALLFSRVHSMGLTTALDTSGQGPEGAGALILPQTDLVLLDIKAKGEELFKKVTGAKEHRTRRFLQEIQDFEVDLLIRFVLVPGLTDSVDHLRALADSLQGIKNLQGLEILPFHKMGEYKWKEVKYEYKLSDTKEPDTQKIQEARSIFEEYGIPVI